MFYVYLTLAIKYFITTLPPRLQGATYTGVCRFNLCTVWILLLTNELFSSFVKNSRNNYASDPGRSVYPIGNKALFS